MTMASGADSSRPRNFASTFLRSLMSRMAAVAKIPSSVASGERLISAGMVGAEALGHQVLDRPAEQVVAAGAEEALRLGVEQHDAAVAVDHDHGVGRGFEQAAELGVEHPRLPQVHEAGGVAEIGDDGGGGGGGGGGAGGSGAGGIGGVRRRRRRWRGWLEGAQGDGHEDGLAVAAEALRLEVRRADGEGFAQLAAGLVAARGGDGEVEEGAVQGLGGRMAGEDLGAAVPGQDLAGRRQRDEGPEELVEDGIGYL